MNRDLTPDFIPGIDHETTHAWATLNCGLTKCWQRSATQQHIELDTSQESGCFHNTLVGNG